MKNVYKYSSWARLAVSTWHAWCALLRMEKLSGWADYSLCSDSDGDEWRVQQPHLKLLF